MGEEKQDEIRARDGPAHGEPVRRRSRRPKEERCRNGVRSELARLMGRKEVQQQIAQALVREATQGNRAGSCIRAFEAIQETLGEAERQPTDGDLSALSTEELMRLLE